MSHTEQIAYYKIDSMPNFKFLLEIEEEHTFLQSEYEENEHDVASCEQWAQGKESPPLMTFQLKWM
jgi:formyltetrahydrofolate synthetase